MKHPIGFCVQPKAPEAASPTPAAQPEAAAVPSVVRVYFCLLYTSDAADEL